MNPLGGANLVIAFAAGFLTFFAGCLAPVAPVYISFLAGSNRGRFLINSILFTSGFLSVFLLFGLSFHSLSQALAAYREPITKLSGIILIVLGLVFGKFVYVPFLGKNYTFGNKTAKTSAFGLGALFGFTWTPCIGPVLAAILFWIASSANFLSGALLLVFYSLGLGLPFVLIGLSFEKIWPIAKRLNTHSDQIAKIAGIIMIIFGILLVTSNYALVAGFLMQKLGSPAVILELQ